MVFGFDVKDDNTGKTMIAEFSAAAFVKLTAVDRKNVGH